MTIEELKRIQIYKREVTALADQLEELEQAEKDFAGQDPTLSAVTRKRMQTVQKQYDRALSWYLDALEDAESFLQEVRENGNIDISALCRFHFLLGWSWERMEKELDIGKRHALRKRVSRYFERLEKKGEQ